RMISPIDIGAIAILVQFEVMHHVRLSGAEPYVTNENIFNGNLLLFALDYQVVRSSRGQRRQRHTPFPILSGCSTITLATKRDTYLFVFIRPSPHLDFRVALNDHAIADECWET